MKLLVINVRAWVINMRAWDFLGGTPYIYIYVCMYVCIKIYMVAYIYIHMYVCVCYFCFRLEIDITCILSTHWCDYVSTQTSQKRVCMCIYMYM